MVLVHRNPMPNKGLHYICFWNAGPFVFVFAAKQHQRLNISPEGG